MLEVELVLREACDGDLPLVCARCGRPAFCHCEVAYTTRRDRKTILVRLPFCNGHQNHFRRAAILRDTGCVLILLVFYVLSWPSTPINTYPAIAGLLCLLGLGVALFAFRRHRCIALTSCNDTTIVLDGVCAEFADAVRQQHAAREQLLDGLRLAERYRLSLEGSREEHIVHQPRTSPHPDEHFHA